MAIHTATLFPCADRSVLIQKHCIPEMTRIDTSRSFSPFQARGNESFRANSACVLPRFVNCRERQTRAPIFLSDSQCNFRLFIAFFGKGEWISKSARRSRHVCREVLLAQIVPHGHVSPQVANYFHFSPEGHISVSKRAVGESCSHEKRVKIRKHVFFTAKLFYIYMSKM